MNDRDVASAIRRAVDEQGGSRWFSVRWLRDSFGRSTLTRKARTEIRDALASIDVLADPPLDVAELDDNVLLYVAERARVQEGENLAMPAYGAGSPNLWQRFRAWPAWAQWTSAGVALLLVVGLLSGGESTDETSPDPQPAQEASSTDTDADDAADRKRARERKRERAREKRERAKERERLRERRERRRERRREEARERREREAAQPPPEEQAPDDGGGDCDPNYSGCVPPYPPDVDCPDVGGPVTVTGSDPHRLDADNDGEGCESG